MARRKARNNFWHFCKAISPEFYTEDRWHLKLISNCLEALHRGEPMPDGKVYRRLIMNIPPRHGKSRTLINYCMWLYGQDVQTRIITASYSDDLATDFSRFTRDGIQVQATYSFDLVYQDIFPEVKISESNAAYQKWALQGQHFSYKGAGIGAGITGKGCTHAIVDDPVKDAEQAYSENSLDKVWRWYTGTFLQRLEEGAKQVINMTRWAKLDPCGRILLGPEKEKWYLLKLEVHNPDRGEGDKAMLCPSIMSYESYLSNQLNMDPPIFRANYHQEPIDIAGILYSHLETYYDLPKDEEGNELTYSRIAYIDTADQGDDFLCGLCANIYQDIAYVTDVIYTPKPQEETESLTVDMLIRNDTRKCKIESNNGGRAFARNIIRLLREAGNNRCNVTWFFQGKNKTARILTNAPTVIQQVRYPLNWRERWPDYYEAMTTYTKEGKHRHDDGPDATTGLVEKANIRMGAMRTALKIDGG